MPGLLSQTSNVLASILGAVRDPQFRSDVRQGLLDAGNRGAVAGLLGGPVDLATMALRPLGYAVDKPVMGSEWIGQKMQDAGIVSGNRNALAEGLASVALPAAAPMLGRGVYAAEQAVARNAMAPTPFNSGTRGQGGAIVWQGSPHKYDPEKLVRLADGTTAYVGGRFNALKEVPPGAQVLQDFPLGRIRSEAIGTGEGAQAYGHGMYFAESPYVGSEYARMNLTGPANVAYVAGRDGGDALSALEAVYQKMPRSWYESAIQKANDQGYLYKVDLPDNAIARMLNWDLPLGQQPEVVQEAMRHKPPVYSGPEYTADELLQAMMSGKELPARQQLVQPEKISLLSQALGQFREKTASTKPPTGEQVYRALADQYGHDKAAAMMRQAGIPGIRYLDGGSRGAGTGTSNFVVFPGEESILSILERNGVPVR